MKRLVYLASAILFASLIIACNQAQKATPNKKADSITTVHNGGVNIAYIDTGKSDTTLLFVHGWGINKEYWSNQIAHFGKRFRVVVIDLPGFGQSGKNRDKWGTDEYAADIDSTIAQLHLKTVILVGHSMAGDIVLQAAINNPHKVIAVVGVDNFNGVGGQTTAADKKAFEGAIAEMRKNFKSAVTEYFTKDLFSKTTPEAVKKRVLDDALSADSVIATNAMEQGTGFDELAKLQEYCKKLYLINSDVHPTETKALNAAKIPYKLLITKGTGHYSFIETPDDFNKDLDEVIGDINNK